MKKITYEIYKLAELCGNLDDVELYNVDTDGECFYNGEKIGRMKTEETTDGLNISFMPYKAVEYIDISFAIGTDL